MTTGPISIDGALVFTFVTYATAYSPCDIYRESDRTALDRLRDLGRRARLQEAWDEYGADLRGDRVNLDRPDLLQSRLADG